MLTGVACPSGPADAPGAGSAEAAGASPGDGDGEAEGDVDGNVEGEEPDGLGAGDPSTPQPVRDRATTPTRTTARSEETR